MGASPYMNQQWAHMRHVSEASATTPAVEETVDHRPSWEPTPPTVTREWNKTISKMKRKVTTLMEAKKAAQFRASKFPSSLLHVEADFRGRSPSRMRCLGLTLRAPAAWRSSGLISGERIDHHDSPERGPLR
jgi:hypothetical protein